MVLLTLGVGNGKMGELLSIGYLGGLIFLVVDVFRTTSPRVPFSPCPGGLGTPDVRSVSSMSTRGSVSHPTEECV